jgi:hypothetical protein
MYQKLAFRSKHANEVGSSVSHQEDQRGHGMPVPAGKGPQVMSTTARELSQALLWLS